MIRAVRSELIKLWRPRPVVLGALVATVYAIASAMLVLAAVRPAGSFGFGPSTESLAEAGGGTAVFTTGLAFAGFFVLVLFIGAVAMEFSRGTARTMTLRQPDRVRLLTGKLLAMLGSAVPRDGQARRPGPGSAGGVRHPVRTNELTLRQTRRAPARRSPTPARAASTITVPP